MELPIDIFISQNDDINIKIIQTVNHVALKTIEKLKILVKELNFEFNKIKAQANNGLDKNALKNKYLLNIKKIKSLITELNQIGF